MVPRPNTQIEEDLGDLDVEASGAAFLPVNETMDKKEESLLIVHETITKTWRTDRSTHPLNGVFSAEVLREIARTTNSRVEIEENRIVVRGDDEANVDKAIQKLNVVDAVAVSSMSLFLSRLSYRFRPDGLPRSGKMTSISTKARSTTCYDLLHSKGSLIGKFT